jgi:ABC-type phosphate transport system substrate-binding protein
MRILPLLATCLCLLGISPAQAEIVVVVDAKAGVDALSQDDVINIFLGRHRKLPIGIAAKPIDQPVTTGLRAEFYRKLVDKSLPEINAYWARLHFSGKSAPPLQANSSNEALQHVIGNPGGIAYIDRSQVDARVRIVLALPQ